MADVSLIYRKYYPNNVYFQRLHGALLTNDLQAVDDIVAQYIRSGPQTGRYSRYISDFTPIIDDALCLDNGDFFAKLVENGLCTRWLIIRVFNAKAERCFQKLGTDINAPCRKDGPPTFMLCKLERDVIFWLIDHGADFNLNEKYNSTTFMSLIVRGCPPDIIEDVLCHPKKVIDTCQGDLLFHAIWRETDVVTVLNLLLDHGAPINEGLYHRHEGARFMNFFMPFSPPLHEAANGNKIEAVECLLAHGADVSIRDAKGMLAVDYAEKGGYDDIAQVLRQAQSKKNAELGIRPSL